MTRQRKTRPKTWSVVGGRIEEYADIAREHGLRAARAAIRRTYGDETAAVYAGLKLFLAEGFNAYYGIGENR